MVLTGSSGDSAAIEEGLPQIGKDLNYRLKGTQRVEGTHIRNNQHKMYLSAFRLTAKQRDSRKNELPGKRGTEKL